MEILFKGTKINTAGNLPPIGNQAPNFKLTPIDLVDISLSQYKGKKIILNVFPSIDTNICAASVRRFNKEASELENTIVLCISRDLPFAHKRFCGTEGLENVVSLSEYRDRNFSEAYKLDFIDGPLRGLLSRVVIVLDENHKIVYSEQVKETTEEPNYQAALEALKSTTTV